MISIILPVYNVEKYVGTCIKSILSQKFNDFELIIVNDGSTDASLDVINEYHDNRIVLVNQANKGLSEARNTGLKYAKGQFVTFVDSDDFVSQYYLEDLYNLMVKEKCDISMCSYTITDGSKFEFKRNKKVLTLTNTKALEYMFYQKVFDTSAWCKLYRTDIFRKINFPPRLIFEDLLTVYKAFLVSTKICFSYNEDYAYRVRNESIMSNKRSLKFNNGYLLANNLLLDIDINKKVNKAILARCYTNGINFVCNANHCDFQKDYQYMMNFLIKNSLNIVFSKALFKVKIYALIIFFFRKKSINIIKKIKK